MTLALPLFGAELERELVGGKARACADLLMLELPVPRGFILTTAAFHAHLESAGLSREYAGLLKSFNGEEEEEALQARCRDLQARIAAAPLPAALRAAIDEQAAGHSGPFAVRSSAVAEDSATTAFAGVFHTELGVALDTIGDAARRCWSHAAGYAAITHALRAGLDPRGCGLALLVQQMVPALRSGVIFTRDPTGADHRAAVIAYVDGLGDGLMQGDEAGASATVARRDGKIRRADSGFDLPPRLRRRLVRLGRRVERELGAPQDIEWAEHADGLVLLQTRPITTLCRPTKKAIRWTRELAEERFPQPISPLGWSILTKILASNVATLKQRFGLIARRPEDVARTHGHYVYSNEDFFSIPGSMRFDPRRQGRFAQQHVQETLALLAQLPGAAVRGGPFGPRWLVMARAFSAFIMPHAREIRATWDAKLAAVLARMDAFKAIDPASLSDEKLWQMKLAIDRAGEDYMEPDLAIYVVKIACVAMVEKIGEHLEGTRDKGFLLRLTAGLDDNRTLLMNAHFEDFFELLRGREDLLQALREERYDEFVAGLPPAPRAAYERYLAENGHVTTNWDIRVPTWGESPENFLRVLRSYLLDPARGLRTFARDGEARAHEARREVRDRMARAPWMAEFFDELVDTLRAFMRIDEEHHFYCSRLYPPLRRLYLEIGVRLQRRGLIRAVDDIFYLQTPEIERMLAGEIRHTARYLVAARRASFERAWSARPPHQFLDERPVPETQPAGGDVLRGVGASQGRATGPVRVVENPEDLAAFRPGEIMVTTSPNPTWTPVYAVAGGLITSTGSLLSHGLVCAREYALPAVIGIQGVTRLLSTGQRVALDGGEGTVTIDPR